MRSAPAVAVLLVATLPGAAPAQRLDDVPARRHAAAAILGTAAGAALGMVAGGAIGRADGTVRPGGAPFMADAGPDVSVVIGVAAGDVLGGALGGWLASRHDTPGGFGRRLLANALGGFLGMVAVVPLYRDGRDPSPGFVIGAVALIQGVTVALVDPGR